ncbi:DUF58 domain-containing protein [Yinghuangia seranimata]|uniref:DUF58 domain-containing protein n=1 Tax=Yinghuangia seranimata TaxID=408067 RepID=UPI00248B4C60|nr:DUF58 domain-containing protein [Yinghuangia seranimata]MDI2131449.1 DUF58 domain-containing protein [Yinghuangia seranimata]
MTLTGRTALLAALGALVVGLLMPSWTGIALVEACVALGVVVDLLLAGPVRGLTFSRGGDTSVRLGEPASVTLTVHNPSTRRVTGLLRDAWPPSAGAARQRHTLAIPAGERRRLTTALVPTRRGDRRAYRVTVRSLGPLGLAGRQGSHEVPWTVRVLPAFPSRRLLPSKLERLRELDGRSAVLTRGRGTEFDTLREYVPGDDVRSIDWRATARSQNVVVRTWRPERDRHILVVLDTGRTSAGRIGDAEGALGNAPRLDAAMDAALLLTAVAAKAGDRVDLLAHDRRVRADVRGTSRTNVLPSFVQAMAPLEPALVESDAPHLVAEIIRRTKRRSLVVLLTGLDTEAVREGLLPVLPQLTSRHEVVVAAVADPALTAMSNGRGTAEAVYAAAAAARELSERQATAAELRRHGVTVVDAPPGDLASQLTDLYLALKLAGRL